MLEKNKSIRALERFFSRTRVADLEALYRVIDTNSRMSVFRRLSLMDYLSSYTHTGRYYTLAHIPEFDEHGLWFFQGVGFSKSGTLKSAVTELVHTSEAGWRHDELESLLRIRVHNTLLILVRDGSIGRERIEMPPSMKYGSSFVPFRGSTKVA